MSPKQRECLDRAAEARKVADAAADERMRKEFLDLEERWRRLADSHDHADRIDRYLSDAAEK